MSFIKKAGEWIVIGLLAAVVCVFFAVILKPIAFPIFDELERWNKQNTGDVTRAETETVRVETVDSPPIAAVPVPVPEPVAPVVKKAKPPKPAPVAKPVAKKPTPKDSGSAPVADDATALWDAVDAANFPGDPVTSPRARHADPPSLVDDPPQGMTIISNGGSLDAWSLKIGLQPVQAQIELCNYDDIARAYAKTQSEQSGVIELQYIIGVDGSLMSIKVLRDTMTHPELTVCVVNAMSRLHVEPPPFKPVTIRHPFSFQQF